MAKGKIASYNPINRVGYIKPESSGEPVVRFYLNTVSNPEPTPKEHDIVSYDAPEPRKSKRGKTVQGDATTVTIDERSPEIPDALRPAPRPKPKFDPFKAQEEESRNKNKKRKARQPREGDRRPRSAEKELAGGKRKLKEFSKAPKVQRNFKFAISKDVSRDIIDTMGSNPSLVHDRFFQWPKFVEKKGEASSQSKRLAKRPPSWQIEERHQDYFLSKTISHLYKNFEIKRLPVAALRSRSDSSDKVLEQSGYSFIKVDSELAIPIVSKGSYSSILNHSGVNLDTIFGFQKIESIKIRDIFLLYLKSLEESEFVKSLIQAIGEGKILFFDAVPRDRIGAGRLKRFSAFSLKFENKTAQVVKTKEVKISNDGDKEENVSSEVKELNGRTVYCYVPSSYSSFIFKLAIHESVGISATELKSQLEEMISSLNSIKRSNKDDLISQSSAVSGTETQLDSNQPSEALDVEAGLGEKRPVSNPSKPTRRKTTFYAISI